MNMAVNPYTFVPHTRAPQRRRPEFGHAKLGEGCWSGVLNLTITARTPLLIGGYCPAADDVISPPLRVPDGAVLIPGSGLFGAFRSVHEALVGGCLRVLDEDHIPVHRHAMTTDVTPNLVMAMVTAVDGNGLPEQVVLCRDVVWIDSALLPTGPDQLLRTGDRVTLPENKAVEVFNRRVLSPRRPNPEGLVGTPGDVARRGSMDAVNLDESWVLLVTSTKARSGDWAYFAAGKIGGTGWNPEKLSVRPDAKQTFARCLEGADDLRPARAAEPPFVPVNWPKEPEVPATRVGERLRASARVHLGQPVWVHEADNEVTEIRLSQVWRYRKTGTVGERLDPSDPAAESARPCTSESLCPSCLVFGSAGTDDREPDEAAKQRSYAGHVRIDDAVAVGNIKLSKPRPLAPLASPKPSAGQFYLDHGSARPLAANDKQPAAHWGSMADDQEQRPIRGRKFYWRTDPQDGAGRGVRRTHHDEKDCCTAELIPKDTAFHTRVTFDNLSPREIGSLVAAIDPRRLWPDAGVVTAVGGGKPFGFGSVSIDVTVEQLDDAGSRYRGAAAAPPSLDDCVKEFRANAGAVVEDVWPALRNALTFGYVHDADVWYPPGKGAKGTPAYDKSFAFFQATTGWRVKREVRHLVTLPAPTAPRDQQKVRANVTITPRNGGDR